MSNFFQKIFSAFHILPIIFLFLYAPSPALARNPNISQHPVFLIVSLNGFRSNYFGRVQTPSLIALKTSGSSVPYMEPVFPTRTFPNHHSIATGVYADTHGVVDNSFYDPKLKKSLGVSDNSFWNYHPDILPIWIRNELAGNGRISGCYMWPGSSQAYGSKSNLRPTYYKSGYDQNISWETRVKAGISWLTNSTKPANLVFLYHHRPDSSGHSYGPNAPETLREVTKADERAGYLVRKLKDAGIYSKINLIILSDHGMEEVSRGKIIDVKKLRESSLVHRSKGYTPVLHLTPKWGKEDELFKRLKDHSKTYNYTVWKKSELRSYPYNYARSRRIMDYVLIADAGYAFDDFYAMANSYDKRTGKGGKVSERKYGVHGYSNQYRSMRAFFIGHGPVFKRGFENKNGMRNIDVVPMLSKIIGIRMPTNGSFERVKEMIRPKYIK